MEPFAEEEIRRLANDWYRKLDVQENAKEVKQ